MNTQLEIVLANAREMRCSDVHIAIANPIRLRKNGALIPYEGCFDDATIEDMIKSMCSKKQWDDLQEGNDQDFTYISEDQQRQRVNVYRQQGKLCAAIRLIENRIRSLDELGMPEVLKKMAKEPRGLVLVTGPTGSGKSTTLAAVMEYINEQRDCHILTIEDPVEYVYQNKKAMIHQREIGADVKSFDMALRSAMREDPDVILVGEMRDYETIAAVITLAETGHLVFSTLHTVGAAKTIDRIIDVFPAEKQEQIRLQLSGVLKAIITQQLLPTADQLGRVAALEILIGTDGVSSLIRENKTHQITSLIQTGGKDGMQTLNLALSQLIKSGKIDVETANKWSDAPEELQQYLY